MSQNSPHSMRTAVMRGYVFEDLTAELFSRLGYTVEREMRSGGVQLDMVIKRDGVSSPVEVSSPRNNTAISKLMVDAARLRSTINENTGLSNPIIVVRCPMTLAAKNWAEQQFDLRVWDSHVLREKATPFPDLLQKLIKHFECEYPQDRSDAKAVSERELLQEELKKHIDNNTLTPTEYEKLCLLVFKHIFDPYLYGFEQQAETSDGGNRYDFICRILPGNSFWDSLRQDFRTKAILFECKNYEKEIGPDQVYSTERYLFTGALRTVCLLVSRLGPNAGAIRAAQGAMRESGKLLILLSNQDLIDMLQLKTQDGGPEGFLDKRIWDFVVSLPR